MHILRRIFLFMAVTFLIFGALQGIAISILQSNALTHIGPTFSQPYIDAAKPLARWFQDVCGYFLAYANPLGVLSIAGYLIMIELTVPRRSRPTRASTAL